MILFLQFVFGIALLVAGAELLVRGAASLALSVGVAPIVVGLTIVAAGTSSPEFFVSLTSAWRGEADIAVGNVVGSNIFNVLFILGLSAIIIPLVVNQQLVRLDVPVMIGVSLLLLGVAWIFGGFNRVWGFVFVSSYGVYIWALLRTSKREKELSGTPGHGAAGDEATGADILPATKSMWVNIALIVGGLAILVFGSNLFVAASVEIARAVGLSELVIGLTIVAAGTSAPEVATSIVAAIRGQRDIAVGNVVGSNIVNILFVLGGAALISPNPIQVAPAALAFDIPFMVAVAVACLPIFFTGYVIKRWEGIVFLGYYAAYVAYLILDATEHDALAGFSWWLFVFVVPLTVITLVISVVLNARDRRRANGSSGGALPAA
jgi:cation:H+ antiporter